MESLKSNFTLFNKLSDEIDEKTEDTIPQNSIHSKAYAMKQFRGFCMER
jgi:hypothetical protein